MQLKMMVVVAMRADLLPDYVGHWYQQRRHEPDRPADVGPYGIVVDADAGGDPGTACVRRVVGVGAYSSRLAQNR